MPAYAFPKTARLCTPTDYQRVFQRAQFKVSSKAVLFLAVPNELSRPRLGLVIGKKNIRLAVQRNRIKRLVRESFRLRQHNIPTLDIVVLARRGLDAKENSMIHAELNSLWDNLLKRANTA
ncbi:MAG: ribonuclease P protein component [Pseudomonadales bacterium]